MNTSFLSSLFPSTPFSPPYSQHPSLYLLFLSLYRIPTQPKSQSNMKSKYTLGKCVTEGFQGDNSMFHFRCDKKRKRSETSYKTFSSHVPTSHSKIEEVLLQDKSKVQINNGSCFVDEASSFTFFIFKSLLWDYYLFPLSIIVTCIKLHFKRLYYYLHPWNIFQN